MLTLCQRNRGIDFSEVVDVGDVQHLPAVGSKALRCVVAKCEISAAVDGDAVVIVEANQFAKLLMSGQ